MAISNPGGGLNSVPAPNKQTLNTNYLDFTGTTDTTWAQQYLPDLMEKEAEVFGPRTISGFLSQVGAEESMQADQVVWSEQGRLHLSYTAMNADAIAKHFYEQGKADAMKDSVAKAKNVNMNPRQAHGQISADGIKVKVLGNNSSDFKFKINKNK